MVKNNICRNLNEKFQGTWTKWKNGDLEAKFPKYINTECEDKKLLLVGIAFTGTGKFVKEKNRNRIRLPLYSQKENKNKKNNAVTIPFPKWRELVNGKPDSIDQVLALKNNDNTKGNLYNYINSLTLSWINRNHIQFIFNTSWKEEEERWKRRMWQLLTLVLINWSVYLA